jgi:hypothetical protein
MPSPNQLTGKVFIRVGNQLIPSRAGAILRNAMGSKRNPVVGNEVHGYTEEALAPEIECEVSHGANISLSDLWDLVDTTCTFECDSGATFVLSNAWVADVNELKGGDGTFKLMINAKRCTEQKAALS